MTFDNLDDRDMDRLCWLLVSTRNRFYPPDETAEECSDTPHDEGYHTGMFIAHNMLMEQLYGYGINVLDRANRYTHMNRKHDMEFRRDEEPDFYRAVKGGAEVKANTSPLYDEIEIESLSWDDRDDSDDDTDLKPVLDWIETLADDRGLSDEEREVASVLARRYLKQTDTNPLPKTVAREAVEEAPEKV